jgi:hypothetical protein
VALAAVSVASCGGSSVRKGGPDDGGEAGTDGSGATGGNAARGGNGTGASGGNGATGATGTGGGTSAGGSAGNSTGGRDCVPLPCPYPACPDGIIVQDDPCGCPRCDCSSVTCPTLDCPPQRVTREFGACCASCAKAPSCDGVACEDRPSGGCGEAASWQQKPGACCSQCLGHEPVGCPEIACSPQTCAPGYVQGDLVGGCCFQCSPDPWFCRGDSDCMIAERPATCCECAGAISIRMYEEDRCWFDPRAPRELPPECNPGTMCGRVCEPCSIPEKARCIDNRCVAE